MNKGYLSIVLHAHLPFVRHPEHPSFFEENWLFEAITECYLPLLSVLDRLQQDLGRTPAEPHLEVSFKIKILGALANLKPIQEIAKLLYFLTGASTERQASY